MSGLVFIVCVPGETHEINLQREIKKKVTIDENTKFLQHHRNDFVRYYMDNEVPSKDKLVRIRENQSMEKTLQNILYELNITNYTWIKRDQDNYSQVIFSVDSTERCDNILEILKQYDIGQKFDSVVNVLPCTVQYYGQQSAKCSEENSGDEADRTTAWNRFLSSVRARLTVAQVVENVKQHAVLTFDFMSLILVSTIMCAVGLVENSNVYLLSSMVICPMMGPVMAGTFGSVIQHKNLLKTGVLNELIGLGLATIVGFCYGSVFCSITDKFGGQDGSQPFPTYEMMSRGELRSLWVGCLIALLSGAVVALGILSDNIASLVGVAISTSLTPPAVNAGLFWSLACIYYIKGNESMRSQNLMLYNYYSNDDVMELLALGAVSMCLTFVNIVCIYAAGIFVFKIKEVAPMSQRDQANRRFWKHDIKIARDYNKTIQSEQSSCMISKLSEELAQYQNSGYNEPLHHSTDLSKDNSKITSNKRSQYTWSPCMNFPINSNIKELSDMYENLVKGATNSVNIQKGKHHYRRLSQIFVKEDDKLNPISEASSTSSNVSHNGTLEKKKFVVTPCTTDLLL